MTTISYRYRLRAKRSGGRGVRRRVGSQNGIADSFDEKMATISIMQSRRRKVESADTIVYIVISLVVRAFLTLPNRIIHASIDSIIILLHVSSNPAQRRIECGHLV
jgi:hypothetical protein